MPLPPGASRPQAHRTLRQGPQPGQINGRGKKTGLCGLPKKSRDPFEPPGAPPRLPVHAAAIPDGQQATVKE